MQENQKYISVSVIKRLPRYHRYLCELLDANINRISSKELSEQMGLTASQIRQDLNNFGCFGKQGYGYDVQLLCSEINKILGLEQSYDLILIGAGNVGQALLNHTNFSRRGYRFVGIFDCNPRLIGTKIKDIEVMNISDLRDFTRCKNVDIAVLSVPSNAALEMAENVIACGVKGIWNFSNTDIDTPKDLVVENVYLMDSLMTLTYKLNENKIIEKINNK